MPLIPCVTPDTLTLRCSGMRSIIQAEIAGELVLPMALIPLIIKAKSKSERLYAKSRTSTNLSKAHMSSHDLLLCTVSRSSSPRQMHVRRFSFFPFHSQFAGLLRVSKAPRSGARNGLPRRTGSYLDHIVNRGVGFARINLLLNPISSSNAL